MSKFSNLLKFSPGIFAIGYTIGTGSVTSMIVAGSSFGMQLLWVLLLSCIFTGTLVYVYGNYYLNTGETALFSFKNRLKYGKILAIFIIIGITIGQWNSLIGILGITSNIIFELISLYYPQLKGYAYISVLAIAIIIIGTMYLILINGNYSLFEKFLTLFVAFMGISFIISVLFVFPLPSEIIQGLIPTIPEVEGGRLLVAAFVGTTMASATFLSRPLFIQGKAWGKSEIKLQRNDAIVSALLVFIISASIMAVASGSLYREGIKVVKVLDMSYALEPLAGRFAVTLFFFGTLSAGLSSIFPCLLIAPILLSDYDYGKIDTQSKRFKIITGIASIIALTIPVFNYSPIAGQILSQVMNVFVLPLVIIGIIILANLKSTPIGARPGWIINTIMVMALIFSLIISWNGAASLMEVF